MGTEQSSKEKLLIKRCDLPKCTEPAIHVLDNLNLCGPHWREIFNNLIRRRYHVPTD